MNISRKVNNIYSQKAVIEYLFLLSYSRVCEIVNGKQDMKPSISHLCAVATALWMLTSNAAESGCMHLYCSSAHNLAWSSIASSAVDVALVWPAGATKARISVKDASGSDIAADEVSSGTDSWRWTVFSGNAPDSDGCFSVKATYFSGDAELHSQSAMLFLHKGTFAPVDVHSNAIGLGFARSPSGRAVAYSTRWFSSDMPPVSMTVTERADGDSRVFSSGESSSGYFLWNPREKGGRSGWYDFVLSCGEESLIGRALIGYEGMRITVR